MSDGPEWFAPKRFGYGTGLPIRWQGWVTLIGFIALVLGLSLLLGRHPGRLIPALMLPILGFILICARTTKGGWRWRWGDED